MATRKGATPGNNDSRYGDSDNPPNSRLFVVCDRVCNETEFQKAFGQYGELEDVRLLKNPKTGEPKGIVYVKFAKSSQAAEALEHLNGTTLENHKKPLKVMVASNRAEGAKRELNEKERLLRLFIVVTKDTTEEKLRTHFSEFGEVVDVLILKEKKTGENKGFAYIRYNKASHAALAYENCDQSYRPVFAEPKNSVQKNQDRNRDRNRDRDREPDRDRVWGRDGGNDRFNDNYGGGGGGGRPPTWARNDQRPSLTHGRMDHNGRYMLSSGGGDGFGSADGYMPGDALYSLNVIATAGVTQLQLWKLFDLIPGLESCDLHMRNCDFEDDPVYATVKYRSSQSAAFAINKLNNFEYPPGYPLSVGEPADSAYGGGGGYPSSSSVSGMMELGKIEKLTNALYQAQSIIKAAGLSSPAFDKGGWDESSNSDFHCSARLPSPKPTALAGTPAMKRLFIVCTPVVLPKPILRDIFGRFEGLLDIYMLPGKTCGFVKYSSEDSADMAMKVLHLQEVGGVRLKVMLADPRDDEIQNKRQKIGD